MSSFDQKSQVQESTDIVDLVGQQIRLQPKGREFVGLCPFHDDNRPSMCVVPHKQIFHCFVCGAGGSVFDWMMKFHKMSFSEALRFLAERAGIELKPLTPRRGESGEAESEDDRQIIAVANDQATRFFAGMLRHSEHGQKVRDYIQQRCISEEMVGAFQLGYAPDRWDGLCQMIAKQRWSARAFRAAGLISERQSGGDFDRMRHRLIFPICDALGRPIAFGGRILPDSTLDDANEAKYLNSPETPLFHKSTTLYGLHLAKKPIIDSRVAVIVEGYTDVIACHQHGFSNVVATLGTAFTKDHAQALRRFADKMVLVFDADEAGQKAADRAVEILLTGTLDVAVTILPEGTDPADLLTSEDGPQQWRQLVDGSADALDYQFERVRGRLDQTTTMAGRERIAEDYLRQLAQQGLARQGMIRKAMIMARLADVLHLSQRQIAGIIRRYESTAPATHGIPAIPGTPGIPGTGGASEKTVPQPTQTPGNQGVDAAEAPNGAIEPDSGPKNEKNSDPSVVRADLTHKIKALETAERQLIGGLLLRPSLFHQALSDGRTLDETLTPQDMVSQSAQALYQWIYDRLCDGHDLTLTQLLAETAATGRSEIGQLATAADTQVERMIVAMHGNDEDNIKQLVINAAESLMNHHTEHRYQLNRSEAAAGDEEDESLAMMQEHLRAHPSGARIAALDG